MAETSEDRIIERKREVGGNLERDLSLWNSSSNLGSAGTADPLDQRATVGAKVMAYTALVLNDLWLVAIEHAVTA